MPKTAAKMPLKRAGVSLFSGLQSRNCHTPSDGVMPAMLGGDDPIMVAAGDHLVVTRRGWSQRICGMAEAASDN